jgi:hypothetical protein
MKLSLKFLALILIPGMLVFMSGCKKKTGPGESTEDIQLGKLSKTWKITSVSLDGVDRTADYTNFSLTISGTAGGSSFGYSTSNRPTLSPWPSSGTWAFGTPPETQIVRDKGNTADELPITYSVSDTQLQVTFNYNGAGYPARVSNVKGQWIFIFGL